MSRYHKGIKFSFDWTLKIGLNFVAFSMLFKSEQSIITMIANILLNNNLSQKSKDGINSVHHKFKYE